MTVSSGRNRGLSRTWDRMSGRRQIVRAAREEFIARGYTATTFARIGARAGLSRPSVNWHFPSKQDLYLEVVADTEHRFLIALGAITKPPLQCDTTLQGELTALLTAVIAVAAEDPSTVAFIMASIVEEHRHCRPAITSYHIALQTFLTRAVQRAAERGELTADTDAASLVTMLTALLCGVGMYACAGNPQDLQSVVDRMSLLLAGALRQARPDC